MVRISREVIAQAMEALTAEERSRLLTLTELVKFISDKFGIPVTEATVRKLKARKRGPVPDAVWGNRELFKPATGAEWVMSLDGAPLGTGSNPDREAANSAA